MRTTIEITDAQRARLLELAAERGEKGFSGLVQEALDAYLESKAHRADKVARALGALGTLSESSAERMMASVRALRERWR